MPTYEFVCKDCGALWSEKLTIAQYGEYADTEAFQCPNEDCGSLNIRREFSPPNISIK